MEVYKEANIEEMTPKETPDYDLDKASIIPEDWKEKIDEIWNEDLVNANRYFASINPKLSHLISEQIREIPEKYYDELVRRWEWHHAFYEDLLHPAISSILTKESSELSPLLIENIKKVYEGISVVDQATLVTTAGIKKHVDYWINQYMERRLVTQEESLMVMTPPIETHMSTYTTDHLQYILAIKTNSEDVPKLKNSLLQKYHLNDEKIFQGRFKKFDSYANKTEEEIKDIVAELEISNDYKTKHFYLTLEKRNLKALSNILEYDNINEHEISTNLIGISGLIFRKKILEYLNDTKLLTNEGKIYSQTDQQIFDALDKLQQYRERYMEKKVQHYVQTGDTCGSACILMALNYLNGVELTDDIEKLIATKSSSIHTVGNLFAGLAVYLNENELDTKLIHSEKDMFKNDGQFDAKTFGHLMEEYSDFCNLGIERGLKVENGSKINSDEILRLIKDDYIIILAGSLGSALHAVLITGYNSDGFIVHDPLKDKTSYWNNERAELFMNTKIGSWLIATRKSQVNINKLIGKLPYYIVSGKQMLELDNPDNMV